MSDSGAEELQCPTRVRGAQGDGVSMDAPGTYTDGPLLSLQRIMLPSAPLESSLRSSTAVGERGQPLATLCSEALLPGGLGRPGQRKNLLSGGPGLSPSHRETPRGGDPEDATSSFSASFLPSFLCPGLLSVPGLVVVLKGSLCTSPETRV